MRLWLDGSPERTVALHCKGDVKLNGATSQFYLIRFILQLEKGDPVLWPVLT